MVGSRDFSKVQKGWKRYLPTFLLGYEETTYEKVMVDGE